jgi:hypothetical protein
MVKKLSKKVVDVETGESRSLDDMLGARANLESKLAKAKNKLLNVQDDIDSMTYALELIQEQLDEAGYVLEEGE